MAMSQGIALAYNAVSKEADDRVKAAANFNPAGAASAGYLAGLNVIMQQKQMQLRNEELAFRQEQSVRQLDLQERGMTLRKNLADRQYALDRDRLDAQVETNREIQSFREQQARIANKFQRSQAAEQTRQFGLEFGQRSLNATLNSILMAQNLEMQRTRVGLAQEEFAWNKGEQSAQMAGMSAATVAWNEQLIGGNLSVEDYDARMQDAFTKIEQEIDDPRAQMYARGFLYKQKEQAKQAARQEITMLEERLQYMAPTDPRRPMLERKLMSLEGFSLYGDARTSNPSAEAAAMTAPGGGILIPDDVTGTDREIYETQNELLRLRSAPIQQKIEDIRSRIRWSKRMEDNPELLTPSGFGAPVGAPGAGVAIMGPERRLEAWEQIKQLEAELRQIHDDIAAELKTR